MSNSEIYCIFIFPNFYLQVRILPACHPTMRRRLIKMEQVNFDYYSCKILYAWLLRKSVINCSSEILIIIKSVDE